MRAMIVLLIVAFAPVVATAADPVVGDRVFLKERAVAKNGDVVVEIERISIPAIVEDVNGDSVWLARGWVSKRDVMSVDDALAAYGEPTLSYARRGCRWRATCGRRPYSSALPDLL